MSRLTELLRQARKADPQLGADLEAEIAALTKRRTFGLVFEQHQPEAVELPGRPVRRGDKVRVLPPRGETKAGDQRLWRVTRIERLDGQRLVHLAELEAEEPETRSVPADDVVVVAEFRDRIYPGLVETGRVERGGDKPFHSVINAENYHALEMLTYTHRHSIDAIYIDPPYNTGAKDWKYNNNYVEGDDDYRHSKWLAFMERRLKIARELLNPDDSVLIVTIDEKEYLRLGLLLEQTFPEARVEMVTSVVNPRGRHRPGRFARSDEYIYLLLLGNAQVGQEEDPDFSGGEKVPWRTLRRSDASSARGTAKGGPAQFYPIYVTPDGRIAEIGDALPHGQDRFSAPSVDGCEAVFPIRDSGLEMNWGLTAPGLRRLHEQGYVRVGRHTPSKPQTWEISYLTSGKISDIEEGKARVVSRDSSGAVVAEYVDGKLKTPVSTWVRPAHNAETGGTLVLRELLPERRFPFPKSLYAVEDTLRFFVKDKPEAVVLDFFSGSGTTAHAVMRLNRQDGGRRQCISVTNNEVSAQEQAGLRRQALRPGDAEWEALGICDYITKPRLTAAITGKTPQGDPIKGDYKFTDEFPMSDGFDENAAFFTLTYEAPLSVRHNRAFERVAPMLWLRAGSCGRIIYDLGEDGWDVTDSYGVLENLDQADEFVAAVSAREDIEIAYVVTDDDSAFQMVCRELPSGVVPVRLYESYLQNFEINTGRSL
ncbi:DNA methyltransferase [Kocuria flava]|uniref:DNA methyltransferase n=1 Tax=Kocuria flava TaxID=446860 RepID=A0A2N4T2A7_9MICC|nr:DNA methyltransferase [Kocuria flava]